MDVCCHSTFSLSLSLFSSPPNSYQSKKEKQKGEAKRGEIEKKRRKKVCFFNTEIKKSSRERREEFDINNTSPLSLSLSPPPTVATVPIPRGKEKRKKGES